MSSQISGNKTIAKNSIYLYLRMFLLMLVSLYTVRVVLDTLGVEDYGIYSAIGGLVVTFSFLSQVLSNASQRFFAVDIGNNDQEGLNSSFSAIIISYIIITIVIIILLETVGTWFVLNKMTIPENRIDVALLLYHFSILTFAVTILTNPFNALIIAHENMKTFAYISIVEGLLKLLVAFSLVYFSADKLKLYAILLFLVSGIIFITYFVISKIYYKEIKFNFRYGLVKVKEVFGYSSWTLFGTIAGVVNGQGINIMLNIFVGPIANAAYAIGNQVSGVVNQLSNSFFSAVRPPLMKSYASGEKEKMNELFYFSNKILFILMSLVILPLYLEVEFILNLWLGTVEPYMVTFTRLLLVYVAVLCLSNPITTIVQAAGEVKKYHGIVDSFTLLSLPISFIAYKRGMRPEGAFIITLLIFVIAHILRLYILKKVMKFSISRYIIRFIIPAFLVVAVSLIGVYYIRMLIENDVLKLCVTIIVSSLLTIIASLFLIMSSQERSQIFNKVKSFV